MPYLTQEQKDALDNGAPPDTAGKLNYVLTRHALTLRANNDEDKFYSAVEVEVCNYLAAVERVNYEVLNSVIGALECCRREWNRRRGTAYARDVSIADTLSDASSDFYTHTVVPYEDKKIAQNGDVYIP